jgi:DNA polymerase-3 subunit delta
MIIKTYQLDKLKENQSNFYLLYGENEGYKNQLIKDILSVGFKDNINRYDESEVINNFDNLITQFTNKSFFEDKKIIIISRATEKINKFFEDIISRNIDDIRIVINAGSLDKKSKLRANFEKKENLICIPFYSDDSLTLGKLANNFFRDKKISISQETINLLVGRCRGDRENLNNELLKIEIYTKNKKKISSEEIFILTNLAQNYSHSELVDLCLSKNLKKTINILNENNYTSDDCITILRIMLAKTKRLFKLKKESKNQKNIDTIISNFKPPIFWKDKEIVKQQMKHWSLKSTGELIIKINEIELMIKKETASSLHILLDFILYQAKVNN